MDGFHDWGKIATRLCLRDSSSRLRCMVPISCCNTTTLLKKPGNNDCFDYILLEGSANIKETIYVDGCVSAFLWRFGKGILVTKIAISVIPLPLQFYMSCCVFILSDHFKWVEQQRKKGKFSKCITTVATIPNE